MKQRKYKEDQLKTKQVTIGDLVHWALVILVLIVVVWARSEGAWNKSKVEIIPIETCNGIPSNETLMNELQERGLVQRWNEQEEEQWNKNKIPIIKINQSNSQEN